jgi:prepilin-type N-terminal cleavage/methylation domain-containing protein
VVKIRSAFTLIELIFAIVVISITVVSLPLLTQTTDRNMEANILQEAIFASETVISEATAYYWDANSQADRNISGGLSRVIDTGDCVPGSPNQRTGHVNRRCLSNLALGVTNNGAIVNTLDSVANVWNNQAVILNAPSGATYKADYNATVNIQYCGNANTCVPFWDSNATANNNLKEIALTIIDSNGNNIITLRTYSANIGDIDVAKRWLP